MFSNNFYSWPPVTLFPKHNAQLISFAGKTTYMVVLIKTDDDDTICPTATFPVCLNFPYTETRWYSNLKDTGCEISVKALRKSPSLNQNQKRKCKKWNERRTTCSSQPWSSFIAAVFICYSFSLQCQGVQVWPTSVLFNVLVTRVAQLRHTNRRVSAFVNWRSADFCLGGLPVEQTVLSRTWNAFHISIYIVITDTKIVFVINFYVDV